MSPSLADAIVAAGVTGLPDGFATRRFTPTDVVDCYLERIASHRSPLGSLVRVDRRGARCAARVSRLRWIHGVPLSALDGVPVAIQSDIAVRGMPLPPGACACTARVAATDADWVACLRAAGAIVLGLLPTDAAALARAPDLDPPLAHPAGGSSIVAAAAVAAGLCAAALGLDATSRIGVAARGARDVRCIADAAQGHAAPYRQRPA